MDFSGLFLPSDIELATGKDEGCSLSVSQQRCKISMVYYFGLVVNEKANEIGCKMASMASLAINWMRYVLAAWRH